MPNRRRLWPVVTAVLLVGVPVLYVLSFGPACWAYGYAMKLGFSPANPVGARLSKFYKPVFWLIHYGPEPVDGALVWYANLLR